MPLKEQNTTLESADNVAIHSRKKDPEEILEFCDHYNKFEDRNAVVPSSFNSIYEHELAEKE